MACGCKRNTGTQFVWTSDDGSDTVTYKTEVEAKAKVIRKGGTYVQAQ